MNQQLPAVRTVAKPEDVAKAFAAAWRALFNAVPTRDALLVLLAHSAFETGRWRSMWCWNLGNVKSSGRDGRDFCYFRCNEVEGGKTVWYDPPHPTTRFRAFPDLLAGVIDHLSFLCRGRYAKAFAHAVAGDPREYVRALKAAGYFTADVGPYERAVVAIFSEYGASNMLRSALDPDAEWAELAHQAHAKQFTVDELLHGRSDDEPNEGEPNA